MKSSNPRGRLLALALVVAMMAGVLPLSAVAAKDYTHLGNNPCLWARARDYALKTSSDALEGSGTEDVPFLIQSPEDAVLFRKLVNDGDTFQGKTVKLANNIELPDDWEPVGNNTRSFQGTFDGNYKQITIPAERKTFFGSLSNDALVKNLVIYGTKINGAGVVDSYTTGQSYTLDDITLKAGTQTLKAGFVTGYGNSSVTIRNSTVEAGVTIGYDKSQSNIGSFGGDFNGTIENCVSYADVYGVDFVGGILGSKGQAMRECQVKACKFFGTVTATGTYAGGIAGSGYGGTNLGIETAPNTTMLTITGCSVSGDVTGDGYVGGILGAEIGLVQCWENGEGYLQNNDFSGKISGKTYVGAIAGYYHSLNKYTNISGNTYRENCGASTGIGQVWLVDTSHPAPTPMEGTQYINTANGTAGCPVVTGCAWRTEHNRTDDPLGADRETLAKAVAEALPKVTKLEVSGSYKTVYKVGETLDLDGIQLTATWNYDDTDGKPHVTYPAVSELDNYEDLNGMKLNTAYPSGTTVDLIYGGISTKINITVIKEATGTIKVTFSLLGDSKHGQTRTPHGLAMGGLTTWIRATTYTVPNNATVKTVFEKALSAHGISWSNPTGNYVSSINGLSEFDNGPNSGWQYTLNDSYSDLGVAEQTLEDGDNIVFHYTDDYTLEDGGTATIKKTTIKTSNFIGDIAQRLSAQGDYLVKTVSQPAVGATGGEWAVLGLARAEHPVPEDYFTNYYANVEAYVQSCQGVLHNKKYTEYSRLVLALTALGKDPRDVAGYDLLAPLSDFEQVIWQGINGPIWALLALDSAQYPIAAAPPGKTQTTREDLVQHILAKEASGGGWGMGDTAEVDITAMAIQALAPYYGQAAVHDAVERGLTFLSDKQDDQGGFANVEEGSCESCAQVIIALTALGIDPMEDPRFQKNDRSVLDAMNDYAVDDGGFCHIPGTDVNGMATEQAFLALAAYIRLLADKTSLYDMTDVNDYSGTEEAYVEQTVEVTGEPVAVTEEKTAPFSWWAIIVLGVGYVAGAATPIIRKKFSR